MQKSVPAWACEDWLWKKRVDAVRPKECMREVV